MLIILQDITEHKKAQEAIQAYAQLKQLNKSKDKFFSIIAHDLLSPVNGVLGSADLLAHYLPSLQEYEIQKLSDGIYASTTHLKRLLMNLLKWARLQKGEMGLHPKKVNLYSLTMAEIDSLTDIARQKEVTIKVFIDEALSVEADEHMLGTVVRNLVANAIKFSNREGTIHLRCEQLETSLQVSVSDTGIGMSKPVQENLFQVDQKQTSLGTAGEKGTGLGLILCKEFIERHGGQIYVESELGKGTTFTFTLPRYLLS